MYLVILILELSKILMYEIFFIHENRIYFERHCIRFLNYIWYFRLWIRYTITKTKKMKKVIWLIKDELGENC